MATIKIIATYEVTLPENVSYTEEQLEEALDAKFSFKETMSHDNPLKVRIFPIETIDIEII